MGMGMGVGHWQTCPWEGRKVSVAALCRAQILKRFTETAVG